MQAAQDAVLLGLLILAGIGSDASVPAAITLGAGITFGPVADRAAWDRLATHAQAADMHQCLWWADPLRAYGSVPTVIGAWLDGELIGGMLLRSTPLPLLPMTIQESDGGPVFDHWDRSFVGPYVDALAEFAGSSRALTVTIRGCPNPIIHADLIEELGSRPGGVDLSTGNVEAVLRLEGETSESLWRGFSHGVRLNLKRASRLPVRVEQITDPSRLREAYETWVATARRREFETVRPWPAIAPVLEHCVASGDGVVFGAIAEGRVIAAIFVTYVGTKALYAYGGHLDGAEPYTPGHLLQLAAIEEALARAIPEYSLGNLPWESNLEERGLRQFKLAFGARPKPLLRTIRWQRHPRMARTLAWLRRQRVGIVLERTLRRRVAARGSRADGNRR